MFPVIALRIAMARAAWKLLIPWPLLELLLFYWEEPYPITHFKECGWGVDGIE
jgi:hypothetical protein